LPRERAKIQFRGAQSRRNARRKQRRAEKFFVQMKIFCKNVLHNFGNCVQLTIK
jgi:hypothetical protein